eukprot:CAMPEP_0119058032 /NCGR_PEP_ID=MMETSP1178-20130426/2400_1 /TAXON_ID=33656 /ORGANISM="unid sp, Strain CCMP2000" /LENGTH=153 /DNA_ID=CAMNT_0007038923 /DNA_START=177 /DNA_END=638 /DNA_ORIENTATION=-
MAMHLLELQAIGNNEPCIVSGKVSSGHKLLPASGAVPREVLRVRSICRELEDISTIELKEALKLKEANETLSPTSVRLEDLSANGYNKAPCAGSASGKVSASRLQKNGELQTPSPRSSCSSRAAGPTVSPAAEGGAVLFSLHESQPTGAGLAF